MLVHTIVCERADDAAILAGAGITTRGSGSIPEQVGRAFRYSDLGQHSDVESAVPI